MRDSPSTLATMPPPQPPPATELGFLDEEECLGFGIFVAELELVAMGGHRDRKPDQGVLLELLQKLFASICATEEPAALKQHQKRCEAALYDIIFKGSCDAVRKKGASSCSSQ